MRLLVSYSKLVKNAIITQFRRAWSSAKPSHSFHQKLMTEIAEHYKAKIPTLKRMKVKTDGCRYKFGWGDFVYASSMC